jgi:hypothetical protein
MHQQLLLITFCAAILIGGVFYFVGRHDKANTPIRVTSPTAWPILQPIMMVRALLGGLIAAGVVVLFYVGAYSAKTHNDSTELFVLFLFFVFGLPWNLVLFIGLIYVAVKAGINLTHGVPLPFIKETIRVGWLASETYVSLVFGAFINGCIFAGLRLARSKQGGNIGNLQNDKK